jgi:hypothetical protein
MTALERIRKKGFRKWYEHQLIESHAWFVTCFVCLILIVSALEAMGTPGLGINRLALMLLAILGGGGFFHAWRRYRRLLDEAEHIAELAVCPACGTYGRFRVVAAGGESPTDSGGEELQSQWIRAHCRHCQHEWRIN